MDKNEIWKNNDYRNLVELFETGVKTKYVFELSIG